jgi:hypothetical protein
VEEKEQNLEDLKKQIRNKLKQNEEPTADDKEEKIENELYKFDFELPELTIKIFNKIEHANA